MATPDIEADFVAKLAALVPASFSVNDGAGTRNLIAGPVRASTAITPAIGEVPMTCAFAEFFSGRTDLAGPGRLRWLDVQLTIRFTPRDYANAEVLARAAHDALDLLGPWQGASGTNYMDLRATVAGPVHTGPAPDDDAEYFVEAFEVWLDG